MVKGEKMNYKLSNQAIGALMLALQKGIMEEIDITTILREFDLVDSTEGLVVENPPIFNLTPEKEEKVDA